MSDIDLPLEIRRSMLFRGLDAADVDKVAAKAEVRRLPRGSVIFVQGRPAVEMLLLVDGWVKATHVTAKGDSIGLRFLQRGEHLGCQAVFRDVPLPATATAVSDCTFLVWETPYVRALIREFPVVSQNALEIVGDRLNQFLGRIQELASEPVEVRIARHLVALVRDSGHRTDRGVGVAFPISRQDLAEMCGTTLFSVSRIFGHWAELGIVEPARKGVVVRDVQRLLDLIDSPHKPRSRA